MTGYLGEGEGGSVLKIHLVVREADSNQGASRLSVSMYEHPWAPGHNTPPLPHQEKEKYTTCPTQPLHRYPGYQGLEVFFLASVGQNRPQAEPRLTSCNRKPRKKSLWHPGYCTVQVHQLIRIGFVDTLELASNGPYFAIRRVIHYGLVHRHNNTR